MVNKKRKEGVVYMELYLVHKVYRSRAVTSLGIFSERTKAIERIARDIDDEDIEKDAYYYRELSTLADGYDDAYFYDESGFQYIYCIDKTDIDGDMHIGYSEVD